MTDTDERGPVRRFAVFAATVGWFGVLLQPYLSLLTGLYPYHFLDVGALGYGRTLANGLGLLFAFVLVSLCLLAAARLQRVA